MICGFESGPMMEVLRDLDSEGIITIKRWLYDPNDCVSFLVDDSRSRAKTTLWRGEWQVLNRFPDDSVTEAVLQQMDWIMQEFARYTEFYRDTYYEYKNIINHMVNEFYNELITYDIQQVLFPDIPHGPINALLYIVAKSMGIDTLYLGVYNYFPGRFMYAHTIEEYGNILSLPDCLIENETVHIERKYEKEWSYMTPEAIKKERGEDWHRKVRSVVSPLLWLKERRKMLHKNKDAYDSVGEYVERKIVKVITKKVRTLMYNKNNKKNVDGVDFSKDYVYVPLHLQPEMTVDTIGLSYRDQLLAVEKVRNIIPKDWYIYIKENPKQTRESRDEKFFKRLNAIAKVKWVPGDTNTYDLIDGAKFVATVTGTAAWEAVTGGKPALVFGVPWFQNFPGIIKYNDSIDWRDIVSCKWNHDDLEKMAMKVNKKLYRGCWLNEDVEKLTDEERVANMKSLKMAMTDIFDRV